jgi:hypothetical protein
MWVRERNKGKNKEKCVNRAIVPDTVVRWLNQDHLAVIAHMFRYISLPQLCFLTLPNLVCYYQYEATVDCNAKAKNKSLDMVLKMFF